VEHVAAADRVAGDHRDDRFRQPADPDLEVEDVQTADAEFVHVAVVAAHLLVPSAAEGKWALAGEDHHADLRILPGRIECRDQLRGGSRPERVADLGSVDRDLRDAVGGLVSHVGEGGRRMAVLGASPCQGRGDHPIRVGGGDVRSWFVHVSIHSESVDSYGLSLA
jgi:hypothetical protein